MKNATLIREIVFTENGIDTNLSVYQHENGGIFAIDSSFLDQCCDDDSYPVILDPFSEDIYLGTDNAIMLCDE